jgi:hypothetical protein
VDKEAAMMNGTSRFPWTRTIQEGIAREALHILQEVIHEFDLGKTGRIRIEGFAHDTPPSIPIGSDDAWRRSRTEVAEMLVSRGVLRSADATYFGGPYVADTDRGYWVFVEADEQMVREAHGELEDRFEPKPAPPQRVPTWESLPQNVRSALPTPQPATPEKVEKPIRVPPEFKEGFFKGAGEHAGKWVMGGVLLIIVAAIGFALRWWQTIIVLLSRPSH